MTGTWLRTPIIRPVAGISRMYSYEPVWPASLQGPGCHSERRAQAQERWPVPRTRHCCRVRKLIPSSAAASRSVRRRRIGAADCGCMRTSSDRSEWSDSTTRRCFDEPHACQYHFDAEKTVAGNIDGDWFFSVWHESGVWRSRADEWLAYCRRPT